MTYKKAHELYGEPLHKKIDILKKVPNLRKISMSPWVKVEEGAEIMGDSYV